MKTYTSLGHQRTMRLCMCQSVPLMLRGLNSSKQTRIIRLLFSKYGIASIKLFEEMYNRNRLILEYSKNSKKGSVAIFSVWLNVDLTLERKQNQPLFYIVYENITNFSS